MARLWGEQGRQIDFICGNPGDPLHRTLPPGVSLIHPPRPIPRGEGSRLRLGQAAAEICRQRDIEGLFIPGNFYFPALDGFTHKRRGEKPFIVCKLSSKLDRPDRPFFRRWGALRVKRKHLRKADAVVAMSPALAEEALRLLGRLPLQVIPDPILDPERDRPTGDSVPRSGLVTAGRLDPAKDFALAIQTLSHLRDPVMTLTILGGGPEQAALERQAQDLGLTERVFFPGRMLDIKPWLRSAQAFLLTSQFEGYPAVAVEALSQGTPVVATDCSPAMREIVNSPARGEVVASSRPQDLARTIDRVLARPLPAAADTEDLWRLHDIDTAAMRYLQLFDS